MEKASANKDISILFDFDGTIGDTETPAMEVAFWELAPYLVNTRESCSLLVVAVSFRGFCVFTCSAYLFTRCLSALSAGDALLLQ